MSSPPLILIIDDNTWMQRIVAKIVASYGWEPLIAGNGYDGVVLALEQIPDLVILDLVMPDLSGMQVLRLLKRLPQTAHIPVLILSVATEAELLMETMRHGAAGFIRKPFTRSTIYEKVTEVLGGGTSASPMPGAPQPAADTAPHESHESKAHSSSAPLDRYRQAPSATDEQELRRWLDSI